MDPHDFLRRNYPLALRWAQLNRFQQHHLNDLAHVLKIVQENGNDIIQVQTTATKIDMVFCSTAASSSTVL